MKITYRELTPEQQEHIFGPFRTAIRDAAMAEEREECARIAESQVCYTEGELQLRRSIVAAIRARGKK